MPDKKCPKCEETKDTSLFCKNKNNKDGLQRICRRCTAKQSKESYIKSPERYKNRVNKQVKKCSEYIDSYKQLNNCKKCGENRYWVLDFHHIDPNKKEWNIGNLKYTGKFTQIKKEIEKCVLLCKNCHYDFHYEEKNSNITIEQYLNTQVSPHAYTM
jgi:hypothetical protein